jgi:hypothetical protein
MDLLIFTLVVLGVTNIIVREYAFNWFRKIFEKHFKYSILNKMIHCEVCVSFWVGCLFSWILNDISSVAILHIFLCGAIASGSTKIISTALYKL